MANNPVYLPDIDEGLVSALESLFPPRCYEGDETVESHLLYAGRVQLIKELREEYTRQVKEAVIDAGLGDAFDDGA